MVAAVPLWSDRCGLVETVVCRRVQFSSGGPVTMWKRSGFPLRSSGKEGCLGSPNLSLYLGRKGLAPSAGWGISQWDDVILSVIQWDSVGH